ncbi:MAG TPA: Flp pilus assembly protein CpaB [Thermoleophilaceae bacterium]|jgi:pilus assembly protein CpaB
MSRRRALAMLVLALISGWLAASDVRSHERRVSAGLGGYAGALVARVDVKAGKRITGAELAQRRLPARFLPPDILGSSADAIGLRAAVAIPRGAYVTASALAAPSGGEEGAAALAPGERAVDVTVANTGAAELGGPGARVDVLVTTGRDGSRGRTNLALQDVPLLAVRRGAGQDSDKLVATLRVTVRQAVYLTAAQNFAQEVRLLPRPGGDRAGVGRLSIGGGQL